jgi:hypothetical protein
VNKTIIKTRRWNGAFQISEELDNKLLAVGLAITLSKNDRILQNVTQGLLRAFMGTVLNLLVP